MLVRHRALLTVGVKHGQPEARLPKAREDEPRFARALALERVDDPVDGAAALSGAFEARLPQPLVFAVDRKRGAPEAASCPRAAPLGRLGRIGSRGGRGSAARSRGRGPGRGHPTPSAPSPSACCPRHDAVAAPQLASTTAAEGLEGIGISGSPTAAGAGYPMTRNPAGFVAPRRPSAVGVAASR